MAESSRVHAPPRGYHPLFPQLSLQIVSNPVWEGLQFASISMEMTYMGLIAGIFRPFRAGMAETFWSVICHKISASLLRGWWVVLCLSSCRKGEAHNARAHLNRRSHPMYCQRPVQYTQDLNLNLSPASSTPTTISLPKFDIPPEAGS